MLVRFQFCTCCFQPLLLSCCQCFPVNRKNFKPFSLLFKVFCLSSILAFVFQRVCFAACSLPTLKMLCLEILLPSPIPDCLSDTSPNLYWFLPQGYQYSPSVSVQSLIVFFFFLFLFFIYLSLFCLPELLDVKFINQNFRMLLETINLGCWSWKKISF